MTTLFSALRKADPFEKIDAAIREIEQGSFDMANTVEHIITPLLQAGHKYLSDKEAYTSKQKLFETVHKIVDLTLSHRLPLSDANISCQSSFKDLTIEKLLIQIGEETAMSASEQVGDQYIIKPGSEGLISQGINAYSIASFYLQHNCDDPNKLQEGISNKAAALFLAQNNYSRAFYIGSPAIQRHMINNFFAPLFQQLIADNHLLNALRILDEKITSTEDINLYGISQITNLNSLTHNFLRQAQEDFFSASNLPSLSPLLCDMTRLSMEQTTREDIKKNITTYFIISYIETCKQHSLPLTESFEQFLIDNQALWFDSLSTFSKETIDFIMQSSSLFDSMIDNESIFTRLDTLLDSVNENPSARNNLYLINILKALSDPKCKNHCTTLDSLEKISLFLKNVSDLPAINQDFVKESITAFIKTLDENEIDFILEKSTLKNLKEHIFKNPDIITSWQEKSHTQLIHTFFDDFQKHSYAFELSKAEISNIAKAFKNCYENIQSEISDVSEAALINKNLLLSFSILDEEINQDEIDHFIEPAILCLLSLNEESFVKTHLVHLINAIYHQDRLSENSLLSLVSLIQIYNNCFEKDFYLNLCLVQSHIELFKNEEELFHLQKALDLLDETLYQNHQDSERQLIKDLLIKDLRFYLYEKYQDVLPSKKLQHDIIEREKAEKIANFEIKADLIRKKLL